MQSDATKVGIGATAVLTIGFHCIFVEGHARAHKHVDPPLAQRDSLHESVHLKPLQVQQRWLRHCFLLLWRTRRSIFDCDCNAARLEGVNSQRTSLPAEP